ncbi:MAG: hypothetical protein JNJ85_08805 [Candidatus Kapabacteria bacterium]|nr:hypothetical protein [Candidatus Kapabacteria bacterium]
MVRLILYIFCGCILLVANGCDGGLDPAMVPQSSFIGGMIRFKGGKNSYPPADSVKLLTVVAFREVPRDTNVLQTVLAGNAYYLQDALVYGADSSEYKLEITKTPDTLRYICVAQQYGGNIFSDWRVVGIYSLKTDFTPETVMMVGGQRKSNLDITVDFTKLPPQPFKR